MPATEAGLNKAETNMPIRTPRGGVVHATVDAAAATCTNASPDIDVEPQLREQLRSRELRATTEPTLDEIAARIRSGHPVELGEHEGSVGEP